MPLNCDLKRWLLWRVTYISKIFFKEFNMLNGKKKMCSQPRKAKTARARKCWEMANRRVEQRAGSKLRTEPLSSKATSYHLVLPSPLTWKEGESEELIFQNFSSVKQNLHPTADNSQGRWMCTDITLHGGTLPHSHQGTTSACRWCGTGKTTEFLIKIQSSEWMTYVLRDDLFLRYGLGLAIPDLRTWHTLLLLTCALVLRSIKNIYNTWRTLLFCMMQYDNIQGPTGISECPSDLPPKALNWARQPPGCKTAAEVWTASQSLMEVAKRQTHQRTSGELWSQKKEGLYFQNFYTYSMQSQSKY